MRKPKKSTIAIILLLVFAMSSLTVYAANPTFYAYFTGTTLSEQYASGTVTKGGVCNQAYIQISSTTQNEGTTSYMIYSDKTHTALLPSALVLNNTDRNVHLVSYKSDVGVGYTGGTQLWLCPAIFAGPTLTLRGEWNPYTASN